MAVSALWSLLGLPFVAVVAKAIFDAATGRTAERRALRRGGCGGTSRVLTCSFTGVTTADPCR
jgi:hypothetical protein